MGLFLVSSRAIGGPKQRAWDARRVRQEQGQAVSMPLVPAACLRACRQTKPTHFEAKAHFAKPPSSAKLKPLSTTHAGLHLCLSEIKCLVVRFCPVALGHKSGLG